MSDSFDMEKVFSAVRSKMEAKKQPVPKSNCRLLKKNMKEILTYCDCDLVRELDEFFEGLLGVLRPEDERCAILDSIDTIKLELRERTSTSHRDTMEVETK